MQWTATCDFKCLSYTHCSSSFALMYTNKLSVAKSSHYFPLPPSPLPPPPLQQHQCSSSRASRWQSGLIFLGFEIRPGKYLIFKPSKVAGGLMPSPTPLLKVKFKGSGSRDRFQKVWQKWTHTGQNLMNSSLFKIIFSNLNYFDANLLRFKENNNKIRMPEARIRNSL